MADLLTDLFAYDDVEANGGTQQAVVPLPFAASDDFELNGAERATFVLDQAHSSFAFVTHESVLRAEFADGDVQEWRVREIALSRDADNARGAVVECESILFDLIHNSDMLERIEANGEVKNHFELYGLSPTQHATKILEAAPSYFSLGTVEDVSEGTIVWHEEMTLIRDRVDMIYHNDSPLSALRELAVVSGLELEVVRNAAVDYKVHLYQQRGEAATTVTVTHASDLLRAARKTLSSDMGTQVYPRGGQEFGNEGSMANHSFLMADLTGTTIDFDEELFSEDDQLNGFYIEDSAGAFIEISDTVAPSRIVLASAPDMSNHGRVRFRRLSGGFYGALTFLPSPAAQVTYGKKPALLDRPDIPLIDNLVPNAFQRDDLWTGDIPKTYQLVGSPIVSKNTDALYTRHGGASWHVTCSGIGMGVETKAFRVIPTEENPFLTVQAQLYIVTGHVRMELIDVTTGDVFPPVGRDAATISTNQWIDSFGVAPGGDPEDNFFTRGTQQVKIRLTQIGDTDAEFYLDALQLTQTPSFTTILYGSRASNDLWFLAKEALEQLISPSSEYDVEMIDLNRIDDVTYPNPVVVGGNVTMTDTDLGINFTTRILSRKRNLLLEGDTQIEVEGKTNDLTRITGQTDRRIRAALGGSEGTLEGEELNPRPPDSTDNLLQGCCSDAEAEGCSPDSAGAWSATPVCDIPLDAAGLSIGSSVAWSADVKTTVTDTDAPFEGEVNAAGTLKKTVHGVLLQDDLDTMTNVTVDAGSAAISGGLLKAEAGSRVRFTGFTAAAQIVAQVEFRAGAFPWGYAGLIGRLDASGDGYGHRDQSSSSGTHGLLRLDAGAITMLDTAGVYSVGGANYPRNWQKVLVADSLQRSHLGGGIGATWGFNATDVVHNGQTGTAGFIVEASGGGGRRVWLTDLIVCSANTITCSGLTTGFKIECGGLQATEVAGTATLDLGSNLFPLSTLLVKNASNVTQATLSPESGIYGGNVFVYDSGGALTGESTFDVETRVDLDFLEADETPISIASWPLGGRSATYERLSGTAVIPALTGIIRVTHRRVGTTQAISCAQKIMVNSGETPAPWVPCELQELGSPGGPAGAYLNRGHELILNWEWGFTSPGYGDNWGVRAGSTGVPNAATPTLGQIDFVLDPGEYVRLEQVTDTDDDVTKVADSTNYRLVPVVPEDWITIAGFFKKSATPELVSAWIDVEFFDKNKVALGPALPGVGPAWNSNVDNHGMKQTTFYVGDPANSASPELIRYVRFQLEARSSGSSTGQDTCAFNFVRAWAHLKDVNASAFLEMQGDGTVDLKWTSQSWCHFAYKAQIIGFPQIADDAAFTWLTESEYLWNDGTYYNTNLKERGTITDILSGALAQGDTCYVAWIVGDHNHFVTNRPGRIMNVEYLELTNPAASVSIEQIAGADGVTLGDVGAADLRTAAAGSDGVELGDSAAVVVDTGIEAVSGSDGLDLGDTGAVTVIGVKAVAASDGVELGDSATVAVTYPVDGADGLDLGDQARWEYQPPTSGLMLDANPDAITDADGATITNWPNWDANNDFVDVVGSPKVHDGVAQNGHRIMRCASGDQYVRWTADSSHSDMASVYAVAKVTSGASASMGVVCLYQSGTERNAFLFRRTTIFDQHFWNNETSWLAASSPTPGISTSTLYSRGWVVKTATMTVVDLYYYAYDGGTHTEEIETSQPDNGMEEFDYYHVGWGGSSTSDFVGDIYRVLVYDAEHSKATAEAILEGLRLEYGST